MKKIVVCLIVILFLLIGCSTKFEVGKYYKLKIDDPFQKQDIIIYVVDIKGEYMLYQYVKPDGSLYDDPAHSYMDLMGHVFVPYEKNGGKNEGLQ